MLTYEVIAVELKPLDSKKDFQAVIMVTSVKPFSLGNRALIYQFVVERVWKKKEATIERLLASFLNDRFSEQEREELSQAIEANYEKIRLIMLEQEKSKDKSKPTLLELGNIGSRFFGFNNYYNDDVDDVPISIRELIPTISSARLDLMATTKKTKSANPNSTYLKVAQVYDDGSRKAKYYAEAIGEDEGIRPP